jgi:O-acetylhomoserine (thiol)-lyase
MKALKLAAIETHVADARTCCLNPATSTHRQMTDEQLKPPRAFPPELVRMSCGLESSADLIADIARRWTGALISAASGPEPEHCCRAHAHH